MFRQSVMAVATVVLMCATTVYAAYRIEVTPMDDLVGEYTVDDFTDTYNFEAVAKKVNFDPFLDLTDVERLTIHVSGTISQITVQGDGVIRPAEQYTLDAGILPKPFLGGLIYWPGIYDSQGIFSDADPGFTGQWVHTHFPKPIIIYDIPMPMPCNELICEPPIPLNPGLTTLSLSVGPLVNELEQIPWLDDDCDPNVELCPIYSSLYGSAAEGLEVISPITLTITDAYMTREWDIPEPGSVGLLAAGSVLLMRRKK